MKWLLILFALCVSAKNAVLPSKDEAGCPFWHVPVTRNGTTMCECAQAFLGVVDCDSMKNTVFVPDCYCMSYLDEDGVTAVIGNCPYTCTYFGNIDSQGCPEEFHRTGQMCGRCEDGFAPPVYSYFFGCVPCSNSTSHNMLKYIAVAYVPLTVFYFVVILFRSSATSAKWNALVLICQLAAFSNIVNNVSKVKHEYLLLTSVLGVFNLDFFRGVYKPFCLSAHLSTLQVTALDYLIGVYPLFLILVTYVLVKLHNNFRLVVQLWKPFNRCFARLNRQWDIKGSLIGAFATFFLLSYVKMLNVSFNLLTPVSLYTVNGTTVNNTFVYFDGTVEYFGPEHLPYGILAVAALLVFSILPVLLLCLYPCYCFQRCLVRSSLSCQALHIFMDSFQGCYKEEPRYNRCFAAVYLLIRFASVACFSLTLIVGAYEIMGVFIILILVILVTVVRPYKQARYNSIDVVLFLTLIGDSTHKSVLFKTNIYKLHLYQVLYWASILTPCVYAFAQIVYGVLPKCALEKMHAFVRKMRSKQDDPVDPWPDRLSEEHTPLISNCK